MGFKWIKYLLNDRKQMQNNIHIWIDYSSEASIDSGSASNSIALQTAGENFPLMPLKRLHIMISMNTDVIWFRYKLSQSKKTKYKRI